MNCSAFSSGSIFLQHRTTSEYPRPSKETILDFDLPRPARPIKTPTTNHTKHPKKTATMVFPFFDLCKELRLQCYEEMLLITSTPAGKHSCSTAILRTCKQAHTEAQKILHEVNEIHIIIETEMCYSDRYGGSNLGMYSTSPEVTVGGGSREHFRNGFALACFRAESAENPSERRRPRDCYSLSRVFPTPATGFSCPPALARSQVCVCGAVAVGLFARLRGWRLQGVARGILYG
jgi:hypothetical protein